MYSKEAHPSQKLLHSRLSEELQSHPSPTYSSGPGPLRTPPPDLIWTWAHFDLIWTWFGPEILVKEGEEYKNGNTLQNPPLWCASCNKKPCMCVASGNKDKNRLVCRLDNLNTIHCACVVRKLELPASGEKAALGISFKTRADEGTVAF